MKNLKRSLWWPVISLGFGVLLMGGIVFLQGGAGTKLPVVIDYTELLRGIDEEAGVVCFRFRTIEGIDCMPIDQTQLRRD